MISILSLGTTALIACVFLGAYLSLSKRMGSRLDRIEDALEHFARDYADRVIEQWKAWGDKKEDEKNKMSDLYFSETDKLRREIKALQDALSDAKSRAEVLEREVEYRSGKESRFSNGLRVAK
ncbi:MAG: hypothetical protein FWG40_00885 [Peptococcaceae bacterium]|nr:hypothetical protein [Peptococcaceae bacterium]